MDSLKTSALPSVPKSGIEEIFTIAGTWKVPMHVSYVKLNVEMFDKIVHTETYLQEKDIGAGDWSYSVKFVPPAVGGTEKVGLAFFAIDASSNALFEIDTSFTLNPHKKEDTKFV